MPLASSAISEMDRLLPTVVSRDRWQLVSIAATIRANEKSDRNYFRLSGPMPSAERRENGNSLSLPWQRTARISSSLFSLSFSPRVSPPLSAIYAHTDVFPRDASIRFVKPSSRIDLCVSASDLFLPCELKEQHHLSSS